MPLNQANIKAVITADDKASKIVSNFGNNVDKTGKKTTKSLRQSYLALTAATAGIVAFGKKSLDEYNKQDLATARLQAGINNVKSAADKNIGSLLKQAAALQQNTRFGDEAIISAQGILSTFQLNQVAIEKLTPRLLDMSEGLAKVDGTMPDLESNAILVAKALGGEDVNGLAGALRRVGVIMTNHQMEILKTGNMQERLAVITSVLDQNYKGLAVSAGDTTAGKIAKLQNNFGDLQEKVGELIANALNPLLDVLNKHPAVLYTVTGAVIALTAAFIALKVAAAISAVMSGASAAISGVGSAATATAGYVTALGAAGVAGMAVFAGAVVAALVVSIKKFNETNKVLNETSAHIDKTYKYVDQTNSAIRQKFEQGKISAKNYHDYISNEVRLATKDAESANAKVKNLSGVKGFFNFLTGRYASGTNYAPGGMALVGEKGPEVVNLPRGSQVIPNDSIHKLTPMTSGGQNINITIQAGVMTGSDSDMRKLASMVMDAYKQVASASGQTPMQMLGAR